MMMARFCARLRKRIDLPSVSMKEIYAHPTVQSLATVLAPAPPAAPVEALRATAPAAAPAAAPLPPVAPKPVGGLQYALCGFLQLLIFLGYTYASAFVGVRSYEWVTRGVGLVDVYVRSVAVGGGTFLAVCLLPIIAKWVLIGR